MAMADIAINIVTKGAELAKRQLGQLGSAGDKTGKGLGRLRIFRGILEFFRHV